MIKAVAKTGDAGTLLGGGYQKNNAPVIAQSILNLDQKFGLFAAPL